MAPPNVVSRCLPVWHQAIQMCLLLQLRCACSPWSAVAALDMWRAMPIIRSSAAANPSSMAAVVATRIVLTAGPSASLAVVIFKLIYKWMMHDVREQCMMKDVNNNYDYWYCKCLYSISGLIGFAAGHVIAPLDVSCIVAYLFAILERAKESLVAAAHVVAVLGLLIIIDAQCGRHTEAARAGLHLAQITCGTPL